VSALFAAAVNSIRYVTAGEPPGGAHLLSHLVECVDLAVLGLCPCLGRSDLAHQLLITEDRQSFHDRVKVSPH
jgi:hypothetical protein